MNLTKRKRLLPLLHSLNSLKPDQRMIILAHLDAKTKNDLYQVIRHVLRSKKLPDGSIRYLRTKLHPFKETLRHLADEKQPRALKAKSLVQVGGGPLGHILPIAIPLLLDTFRK